MIENRSFKYYNTDHFMADLAADLINRSCDSNNPSATWDTFRNIFNRNAEIHAPSRGRRARSQYAPWFYEDLKQRMNNRDFLEKKATQTKSVAYHRAFKEARNHVNKAIKKAKKDYYHIKIENIKGNLKTMWKHLNKLTERNSKSTHIEAIKHNNTTVYQDEEIAQTFNNYSVDIVQKLSDNIPYTDVEFE